MHDGYAILFHKPDVRDYDTPLLALRPGMNLILSTHGDPFLLAFIIPVVFITRNSNIRLTFSDSYVVKKLSDNKKTSLKS